MIDTLGSVIRTGRERRGWNQAQLASRIGVTGSFIGKLEKDEALPSYDRLIALASVLGLDGSVLLALSEQRKEERAQARIRSRGNAARTAYGLTDSEAGGSPAGAIEPIDSSGTGDTDLRKAMERLRLIFSDPTLKRAMMTPLEAFALQADKEQKRRLGRL